MRNKIDRLLDKKYYETNKEVIRARAREYYWRYREEILAEYKRKRIENPEAIRAYHRKYQKLYRARQAKKAASEPAVNQA